MQRNQKIITTVLWSFLVLTMVAVVGRGMWASQDGNAPAARGVESSIDAPIGSDGLPVLFDAPAFTLTDQDAKSFDSAQLKGKPWVAAFIFTRCAQACPMMTRRFAKLQETVPDKRVHLVSFSVDPQHDTPTVLKQYAEKSNADPARWHFLTGEQQAILKAAAGLKLSVIPGQDGEGIDHAEKFLLVDGGGRVRGIYDSNDDAQMKRLARDASTLVAGSGA
jgi:protein SCO1